ncbi:MAG: Asp23/Gls24 family envelope stress response protein [Oscillospiraceae bacterium]|jgi:uncharacterized alkaline shock family protein YloU|nr:Asp23/Gls24 family envelope stress response protein [Oscillospiraceae bacterium]
MDQPKDGGPNGGVVISEEVLASIAVTAAREVEGVAALVPRPANVARLLRKRGDLRYVKLAQSGAQLSLEMTLRVRAGVNIASLACEVQRAVKAALQDMTGKTVARVNLRIAGAEF